MLFNFARSPSKFSIVILRMPVSSKYSGIPIIGKSPALDAAPQTSISSSAASRDDGLVKR